ncbi:MAG TPA: bifunctional hydroxymethylpyrimidine kinase/phosphomethylpyrimidine kinase [Terriglobales bacterium]
MADNPIVLSIAGFDPSSGAGVTADIKTIAAHGCYGVACVTALTVQSTQRVRRVEPLNPRLVTSTLEELGADFEISAVHIGMLGNGRVVRAVARFLERSKIPNVVLDPILKSSSGTTLLNRPGRKLLLDQLFPLATVSTPNAEEASVLTGMPVKGLEDMRGAAAKLHAQGARAVVITGGEFEQATELLSVAPDSPVVGNAVPQGPIQQVFKSERQQSTSTHGTGCAFATALACHLALGRGLPEAVLLAKAYVSAAIANAVPIGRGTGPVHHLYRMDQSRRAATAPERSEG